MNPKIFILTVWLASTLQGCGGPPQGGAPGGPGGGAAPPPPTVEVASVRREPVSVFRDYTAELKPVQTVEIRTRVGGTLEAVYFAEGSLVEEGQVLFQIDSAPYLADIQAAEATLARAQASVTQSTARVAEAQGAVAQAEARLQKARTQVNLQESTADLARAEATLQAAEREVLRYLPLRDQGAVPNQQYDQAVDRRDVARAERDAVRARLANTQVNDVADVRVAQADLQSAQANLQSARASVESSQAEVLAAQNELQRAKLYLGYTTIRAPFRGFIGRLNLDRGTMIVQGNAVLATLNAANPIYADFSISESEYLALQRQGGLGSSPFTLTLADGERFPGTGEFVLTENQVDAQTGTLMLRARFDNPSLLLKPGGFGRVTMKSHDLDQALVIPQKAVFSNQSLTSVYIVKDDNTVEPRNVQLGESLGEQVVVAGGLEPGETIVVDGLQKVRPGAPITPQQAGAPDGSAQPGAASGAKAG